MKWMGRMSQSEIFGMNRSPDHRRMDKDQVMTKIWVMGARNYNKRIVQRSTSLFVQMRARCQNRVALTPVTRVSPAKPDLLRST